MVGMSTDTQVVTPWIHATYGTTKHPEFLMIWACFSTKSAGELIVLPKNKYMNQYI